MRNRADADDPNSFADGDPTLAPDGYVLISAGPDQRYANNDIDSLQSAVGDPLGVGSVEKDNITTLP
jgi:hypothetical protein